MKRRVGGDLLGSSRLVTREDRAECTIDHRASKALDVRNRVWGDLVTVDAELELLQMHRIDAVVAKNAGGTATAAKLVAARRLALPVVMIDRPPQPAGVELVADVEGALAWLSPGGGAR